MRSSPGLRLAMALGALAAAGGAQAPAAGSLAAALAEAYHPRLTQVATVENVTFDWDALHWQLKRGQLALAAPLANGRIVAAVFTGTGELEVTPPNPIEAQQMRFFSGKSPLAEPFTEAVFRFADGQLLVDAIGDQAHFHALGDAHAFEALLAARAKVAEQNGLPEAPRLLLAVQGEAALPVAGRYFTAELHTVTHDWIEAVDDPMRAEAIRVHGWSEKPIDLLFARAYVRMSDLQAAGGNPAAIFNAPQPVLTGFDDTWCEFAPAGAFTPIPPWRLEQYELNLDIPHRLLDASLQGRALQFRAGATLHAAWSPGEMVWLQLDSRLRVASATLDGKPVEWLQPRAPKAGPPPAIAEPDYEGMWLLLRLPQALEPGEAAQLALTYAPADAQDLDWLQRNPWWYPVAAPGPAVTTSFHFEATSDPGIHVIGAGTQVKDDHSGEQWHTAWDVAAAAGYGFVLRTKAMDSDRPLTAVATLEGNRTATVYEEEKNRALLDTAVNALRFYDHAFGGYGLPTLSLSEAAETWRFQIIDGLPTPATRRPRGMAAPTGPMGPQYVDQLDPVSNLGPAFGPLAPDSSGSQPAGRNAPVWPGLSLVSPLSVWDQTQLHYLNPQQALTPATTNRLLTLMPALAVAQQWFGASVGRLLPRDQWLEDGFAHGAALLFLEKSEGREADRPFLQSWRQDLLEADRYSHTPDDDGPLWLGARLASSRDPLGDEIVTSEKGGYVFYMLRQMMNDERRAEPDDAFYAMMHAWTQAWAGRTPATADFQALAEQYMTPEMDLDGNHRLDWFFNAYVYGTVVPHLVFRSSVTPAADGKFEVRVSVQNPDNWRGLLPIYLMKKGGDYQRGWVHVAGPSVTFTSKVDFEPVNVVANRFEDMLVTLQ